MALGTLRFVTRNFCEDIDTSGSPATYLPTTVVANGFLAGAPARDENPAYPMENALTQDRYSVWQTSPTPGQLFPNTGSVLFDIKLVAVQTVTVAAVLGLRRTVRYQLPQGFQAFHSSSPLVYPPTAGSTWVPHPTAIFPGRDGGVVFAPASAQYWRFQFSVPVLPFSVGKLLLGNIEVDTGVVLSPGSIYSDGAVYRTLRNRTRNRTLMGSPVITERGDDSGSYVLPFRSVPTAVKDALGLIAYQKRPTTMIDPFNLFTEVELANDEFAPVHRWAAPDLWDIDLALEVLG